MEENIDQVLADVLSGKIDTSCCPEVAEILKKFQRGEASRDELKSALIRKQSEIVKMV